MTQENTVFGSDFLTASTNIFTKDLCGLGLTVT
jgi:hypothetical protein